MNLHSKARTCPESRALLVERVIRLGWSVSHAADAAGVSTKTAYKWLARYADGGAASLVDRSSRPRSSPNQLAKEWVELILLLRRSRMSGPAIAERLKLPKSTVARVLKRHGLSRLRALEPVRPVTRYEWDKPGDLLHLDVKKLGRIKGIGHRITGDRTSRNRGIGWEYVHVCVDDASRVAYVEVLGDETGDTSAAFLRRAVAWYRSLGIRVRRVLTDNGSGYRSRLFAVACRELNVAHRRTRPYTPRTNGKAERFIQTLRRECAYAIAFTSSAQRRIALAGWLRHYNEGRIHGALKTTPLVRLRRAA